MGVSMEISPTVVCCLPHRKGFCDRCGGPLKTKRQQRFCSKECSEIFYDNHFWQTASSECCHRAGQKCSKCGWKGGELKRGPDFPNDRWKPLEAHHKRPLQGRRRVWSCENHQDNLIALCHWCHVEEGKKLNEAAKPHLKVKHDREKGIQTATQLQARLL